ncbi:MAG: hypothetical protein R3C45_12710 [Phycisphaerales bacterium]
MMSRPRRALLWVTWLGIVVAACTGLSRYRIDNDLRRWMPDLAGLDALSSVVIVGYDRDTANGNEITGLIGKGERVAFVWPIVGDRRMDGLVVTPKPGVASASLLGDVRASVASQPGRVVLAGPAVFSEAINEWSQRGLPLATGLILAIGAVTLYLTTRRVRPAVEGLTAVFSSQLVLVGAIAWTGRAMDMMLSMTPPLMMALGYSFAAHRALRRGANRALLLSMVTTSLSLLSFTLTDFVPIRSFAWCGAAGVMVTWAAVMLLVTPPDSAVSDCPVHAIAVPPRNNRAWAMMLTGTGLAVTVAGLGLAGLIHVEQDVLRAFPSDAGIAKDYRLLNDELTGMLPFEVHVLGDVDPVPMLRDTPGVRRVVPLPKSLTAPRPGRWYLGFADNDALPGLVASQHDWRAWAKSNQIELEWAGVAAQIDHIGRSVMRAARRGVPIMALIAGLAAWLIDRRWSTAVERLRQPVPVIDFDHRRCGDAPPGRPADAGDRFAGDRHRDRRHASPAVGPPGLRLDERCRPPAAVRALGSSLAVALHRHARAGAASPDGRVRPDCFGGGARRRPGDLVLLPAAVVLRSARIKPVWSMANRSRLYQSVCFGRSIPQLPRHHASAPCSSHAASHARRPRRHDQTG